MEETGAIATFSINKDHSILKKEFSSPILDNPLFLWDSFLRLSSYRLSGMSGRSSLLNPCSVTENIRVMSTCKFLHLFLLILTFHSSIYVRDSEGGHQNNAKPFRGSKSYSCKDSDRSFSSKSNLSKHSTIHTGN